MNEKKKNDIIAQLKKYFYQTRWMIVLSGVAAFIAHGSVVFSQRIGFDTDAIMDGVHNFDQVGRYGLVWLAQLLELKWFNLYHAQILALLFIMLAPVSFGCLFYCVYGQNSRIKPAQCVLSVLFIISPFWAAQIYFLNQSPQVLLACILIPVTLLLIETARVDLAHKWPCILLAIPLANIIFACYQVLVVIYLAALAVVFVLYSLKEERTVRQQFQWLGLHVACFLAGLLSYMIVSGLFYSSEGNYLTEQITWGQGSVREDLMRCVRAVLNTFLNRPPYFSGSYGIYALLFLSVILYRLATGGRLKKFNSVLTLLAAVFLIFSPHVFIILYGGDIMDRMQLVMPLSQGSMLYLVIVLLPEIKIKNIFKKVAASIAGVGLVMVLGRDILFQLNYCNRLYYTDEWIFQYESQILQKIYIDAQECKALNKLEDSFDNYLILGIPELPYNATTLKGDCLGVSFFEWDYTTINRGRTMRLMRNLGYPLTIYFSEGEMAAFDAYFENYFGELVDGMPCYPEQGYMQYLRNDEIGLDYMVIKMEANWRHP